jgi:predicted Zn-dependent protease with MMP-like domain
VGRGLQKRFDSLALEVWRDLQKIIPAEFQDEIGKIHILMMDEPTPDLLADLPEELAEEPEFLDGLHVGTPMTEVSFLAPESEPVRVYLFRKSLCDGLDGEPDGEEILREEIAVTLLHEIGHYFGLSEEDLERLGYD